MDKDILLKDATPNELMDRAEELGYTLVKREIPDSVDMNLEEGKVLAGEE